MTRRILVALDPDADTPVATRYAIEIAQRYEGELTGLALVNTSAIEGATAGGGIGAMYFAERLRQELTEETRSRAQELLARFVAQVEAAGARHSDDHIAETDVVRGVTEDLKTHDLLVVGRESHFYYANPERRTQAVSKIVFDGAGAALIVGTTYREVRRVVVAYDGGTPAARALQKFVHLSPFGTELAVEIVHVRSGGEEARLASEAMLRGVKGYLEAYGYGPVQTSSLEGSRPVELITARAAEADLLVTGAYETTGLKRLFVGSTAKAFIDESPVPLFLYR